MRLQYDPELYKYKREYIPQMDEYFGGRNAALLCWDLFSWTGCQSDSNGWIYKQRHDIVRELSIGFKAQEKARDQLQTRGLIQFQCRGIGRGKAINYKLNVQAFLALLEQFKQDQREAEQERREARAPGCLVPKEQKVLFQKSGKYSYNSMGTVNEVEGEIESFTHTYKISRTGLTWTGHIQELQDALFPVVQASY